MMDKPDLGEQAISKAAEVGMKSQLDEAEDLQVDIRTDPGKLIQGELESVNIDGKGLVMQKDLRTEKLEVHTDSISINPMKAVFGDIELERPTQAKARVILTESDIERAFNSDYIRSKLQGVQIQVNGKPQTVNAQQVKFSLPGEQKVALSAKVEVVETGETKQVEFTATPKVDAGGQRVSLENVQYAAGKEASPELTDAMIQTAGELLDLRNFELQGMSLRLQQLEVQTGKLYLQAEANVREFPGA